MTKTRTENKRIVIVAGETSGDQHGAKLVRAMQAANPTLSFRGVGSTAMRSAGVRLEVDAALLTVVGVTEVLSKLPAAVMALRAVKRLLQSWQPALLILIDFPDFNLRLAAAAKKIGIPVLYYIGPQIWAWRPGRVKRIARCVDHMAVILPFEEDFYRKHQITATFVGHPLLDDPQQSGLQTNKSPAASNPVVGLMPGSRPIEIKRHLPILLSVARLLQQRRPDIEIKFSRASNLAEDLFNQVLAEKERSLTLSLESGNVERLLSTCDVVVAVSGTITLQAALCGTPMIIIYKVSPLSYWIGRALIRVPYIGLVNLVAGRKLAAEFVQKAVSAERIASKVDEMLADPNSLAQTRQELKSLRHLLGGSGASARVADIALSMLR